MIKCKCESCDAVLPYDELWFARKKQHVLHHKESIKSKNKIWCNCVVFTFLIERGGDSI